MAQGTLRPLKVQCSEGAEYFVKEAPGYRKHKGAEEEGSKTPLGIKDKSQEKNREGNGMGIVCRGGQKGTKLPWGQGTAAVD